YATSVISVGKNVVYGNVLDGASALNGLKLDKSAGAVSLPDDVSDISDEFLLINDQNGTAVAIIYAKNIVWDENGDNISGSELYGLFFDGENWGSPVAIHTSSVYACKNRYISSYSAVLSNNQLLLNVSYVDEYGMPVSTVTDYYELTSNCSLDHYETSYVNQSLDITITNNGAKPTGIYAIVDGTQIPLTATLASGTTGNYSVDLSQYQGTVLISLYDSTTDTMIGAPITVSLNYSDLSPYVKQLLLGSRNKLLFAIKNTGNLKDSGNLYVAVGNYTAENIKAAASVFSLGEISPGQTIYLEIPLENGIVIDENTIISIYTESLNGVEKGDAADNNLIHITAKEFSSEVSSYEPEIGLHSAKYDKKDKHDIEISYYCSADDSIKEIKCNDSLLLAGSDYEISDHKLLIKTSYLDNLAAGKYTFNVEFTGDRTETVTITIIEYFIVRWENSDGSLILETEVAEGTLPYCDVEPEKNSTDEFDYVFAGWDIDGDGKANPLVPTLKNEVYTAVWYEIAREYQITWRFTVDDGEFSITESYAYGKTPKYNGTIYAPCGKLFVGWDNEIQPTEGDRTYSAIYKKETTGVGVISTSDFRVAPGIDFNTTLSIQGTDIKNTIIKITFDHEIATLKSITLPEQVKLVEQGEDYLTIEVLSAEDNAKVSVADITFSASEGITTGNYAFLNATSDDLIESDFQEVNIYDTGDLNGDGKVNTRDLAMLRQYVVGMIVLDDAQLAYANVYKDFDENNKPKVNTRDIGILQQFIVGLVDKID
ncbi:MAG: hypothetical protein IJX08_08690, partial [Clostridia bacterium]|nr:hypothetical protein [Clostridia bacterium]